MNQNLPPAGWYLDPTGVADGRYWDGAAWTAAVTRSGTTVTVPMDPTMATVPPLPGSAIQTASGAPGAQASSDRSPLLIGIGVMVAVLLFVVMFLIISDNGATDESPPPSTEAPATAPAATEPPATEPPATEAPTDGG